MTASSRRKTTQYTCTEQLQFATKIICLLPEGSRKHMGKKSNGRPSRSKANCKHHPYTGWAQFVDVTIRIWWSAITRDFKVSHPLKSVFASRISLLLLYNCHYNQRQWQKYRPLCEFSITDLALLLQYNYSHYSIAPYEKGSAARISLCCHCIIVTTTGEIKVSPPLLVQTHGSLFAVTV